MIVRCVCGAILEAAGTPYDTGVARKSFIDAHYQCRKDLDSAPGLSVKIRTTPREPTTLETISI